MQRAVYIITSLLQFMHQEGYDVQNGREKKYFFKTIQCSALRVLGKNTDKTIINQKIFSLINEEFTNR